MYLFETGEFRTRAAQHQLDLGALRQALAANPGMRGVWMLFEPKGGYLRRRAGRLRIIASLRRLQESTILCLLDVLEENSHQYRRFCRDPEDPNNHPRSWEVSEDQLRNWLHQQRASHPSAEYPPEVPIELRGWLDPPTWAPERECGVYESELWVETFRQPSFRNRWYEFCKALESVALQTACDGLARAFEPRMLETETKTYSILYDTFLVENSQQGIAWPAIFLLAAYQGQAHATQRQRDIANYHPLGSAILAGAACPRSLSADQLARCASRAYPWHTLDSTRDIWRRIVVEAEDREVANLALSAEEENLLCSLSAHPQPHGTLPLFINGRAGSGKSTILYYLFAGYLRRKFTGALPGEPLFLCYQDRLIERAHNTVKKIFTCNPSLAPSKGITEIAADTLGLNEMPDIGPFFVTLRRFLLSQLPYDKRLRFEREDRYIDFNRFKRLYSGDKVPELGGGARPLRQRLPYSAEVAWHVIRTFIKGYRADSYLGPEDYNEEVPRRERTVREDVYRAIYERVWLAWYSVLTEDDEYWDDLDLVRVVLLCERPPGSHPVVICDEAQDFTRVELQLIMRANAFGLYDLGRSTNPNLPLAFAGDPFQTLHPTGFRWGAVKAAFREEVAARVDPCCTGRVDVNFHELLYNYRSSEPIVRFSNLIQYYRSFLFGLRELRPQKAWRTGPEIKPLRFILGTTLTVDEFREQGEEALLLVPCEQGGEAEFVSQDDTLKQLEWPVEAVLSASAAKGLEFDRVVLYKWGDACPDEAWVSDEGPRIEAQYFFNKLYVAATRATARLFIVDTESGEERLWNRLAVPDEPTANEWQAAETVRGTAEMLTEMRERNPARIAEEFERGGEQRKDSDLLRRAAWWWRRAGQQRRAKVCEAHALRFDGWYTKASAAFRELEMTRQAWECLWEGGCWQELNVWSLEHGHPEAIEMAAFMTDAPTNVEAIRKMSRFLEQLMDRHTESSFWRRPQWDAVLAEYAHRIGQLPRTALPEAQEWAHLGGIMGRLIQQGFVKLRDAAGRCYWWAGMFPSVVALWDHLPDAKDRAEYFVSKAESIGYPSGYQWLRRIQPSALRKHWVWVDIDEPAQEKDPRLYVLLGKWKKAGRPASDEWLKEMEGVWRETREYGEGFRTLWRVKEPRRYAALKEFLLAAWKEKQIEDPAEVFGDVSDWLMACEMWNEVAELMSAVLPLVPDIEEKLALGAEFVHRFARSTTSLDSEPVARLLIQLEDARGRRQPWLVQEMGAAFERAGRHVAALQFYERYVDSEDPELKQFARERWLVCKRRQVDRIEPDRKLEKDTRELELKNRCHDWGYIEEMPKKLPEFPDLRKVVAVVVVRQVAGSVSDNLASGDIRLTCRNIEVRTGWRHGWVMVTELEKGQGLTLRISRMQIEGYTAFTITRQTANHLEADLFGGRCRLVMSVRGQEAELEVGFGGLRQDKAVIRIPLETASQAVRSGADQS